MESVTYNNKNGIFEFTKSDVPEEYDYFTIMAMELIDKGKGWWQSPLNLFDRCWPAHSHAVFRRHAH